MTFDVVTAAKCQQAKPGTTEHNVWLSFILPQMSPTESRELAEYVAAQSDAQTLAQVRKQVTADYSEFPECPDMADLTAADLLDALKRVAQGLRASQSERGSEQSAWRGYSVRGIKFADGSSIKVTLTSPAKSVGSK